MPLWHIIAPPNLFLLSAEEEEEEEEEEAEEEEKEKEKEEVAVHYGKRLVVLSIRLGSRIWRGSR